ncbi:MAG: hypothetical protein WBD95_24980 [Xanthobacteraceae bacterium]
MKRKLWSGEISWFNRDGSGRSGKARIVGSERGDQIVFEYTWDRRRCIAEFDKLSGRGSARHVGASVSHAKFTGLAHKPSEDQVEMQGGIWVEDGNDYDWKADLGDY